MKKAFLTLLLFCTCVAAHTQNLDEYEYVRVPEKFEFSDEENEHQLNALTEFLFEKYGFKALYNEPDPTDAAPCDILSADVKNDSNLFRSKLFVTLRNCRNEIVFTSKIGSSSEKDYKRGFHEALREAFESIAALDRPEEDPALVNAEPELIPTPAQKPQVEGRIDPEVTESAGEPEEIPADILIPTPAQKPQVEGRVDPEVTETSVEPEDIGADVLIPEPANVPKVEVAAGKSGDAELYAFGNQLYYLEATASGLGIFLPDTKEKIATLTKSANGENFIYSSEAINGNAFFDAEGNLIVEYINDLGELVTRTYERRD